MIIFLEVSFEDLLKVGNDPRKLEKIGKTSKYGSRIALMSIGKKSWILADGQIINVPDEHAVTALKILKDRGDPNFKHIKPGYRDQQEALYTLLDEGSARVYEYGKAVGVLVYSNASAKVLKSLIDFLISVNTPVDAEIEFSYERSSKSVKLTFEDLLEIGPSPVKLENFGKLKKVAMNLIRIADKVAKNFDKISNFS